jgi:hypothetical protein
VVRDLDTDEPGAEPGPNEPTAHEPDADERHAHNHNPASERLP